MSCKIVEINNILSKLMFLYNQNYIWYNYFTMSCNMLTFHYNIILSKII